MSFFHALAAVEAFGGELTPRSQELLSHALPMEIWREGYFGNVNDLFYIHEMRRDLPEGWTRKDLFIQSFLEGLRYPGITIYDKLFATDIFWSAAPIRGVCYENIQMGFASAMETIVPQHARPKQAFPELQQFVKKQILGSQYSYTLYAVFLWRTGICLLMFFILIFYWLRKKRGDLLLCLMPAFGVAFVLMLAAHHSQEYRYFQWLHLIFPPLLLLTMTLRKEEERNTGSTN